MKILNPWLSAGVLTILTGLIPALAEEPPRLGIDLSARPEITVFGTTGSVYVVQSNDNPDQSDVWKSQAFLQISSSNRVFVDAAARATTSRFYRTLLQSPPTNMVFIPPNTFTLGSPTNEVGHQTDESPQTLVTLSHGYWMAKFLVTQREYVAVTGSNPSGFPGDLSRPVESVSWFAASNYCAQLTLQELTAGRIAPGSRYRLPTEAEWECAARAGTSTRFYYGDDPNVTSLTNHAWYGAIGGATTHPVGLKQPNAWGLYDMEGNVW